MYIYVTVHATTSSLHLLHISPALLLAFSVEEKNRNMDKRRKKQPKTKISTTCCSEEVSSREWEIIDMSEQEEDLIYRMYKLVGDRWALIAGRIPGRKAEEIERFWIMRHGDVFAVGRREIRPCNNY